MELEIHIVVEGGGTKDSSERKLVKKVLSNEVLFTPIRKVDLIS
jgi:hypothetical protein